MRLQPSVWMCACWLVACGGDSPAPKSFPSPWGDPGSSVVCGPGTYLVGQQCLPDGSHTSLDGGPGEPVPDGGDGSSEIDVRTACLGYDNKFVIAGEDYVHSGPPLVIEGGDGWSVHASGWFGELPSQLDINAGKHWFVTLSTESLGKGLEPGTYVDVQRASFTDPNRPGLDVSGAGAGCNEVGGSFTVLEIQTEPDERSVRPFGPLFADDAGAGGDAGEPLDASVPEDAGVGDDVGEPSDAGVPTPPKPRRLSSFTATFEQHCEGGPSFNVGCIHVVGSTQRP